MTFSLKSFILLVLVSVVLTSLVQLSSAVSCSPSPGLTRAQCDVKRASSCQMKFTGPGCKRKNGRRWQDGGCQCDEYCGYRCKKACVRDTQCKWNRNQKKCFNKRFNTPGEPIQQCSEPCFHRSSTVELATGENIQIDKVRYGDRILAFDPYTLETKYSPVVAFTGFLPNAEGSAVRISVKGGRRPLIVSLTHLILASVDGTAQPDFIQAQYVKAGSMVYHDGVASRVTSVKALKETGWITPLTKDGTIVVDGIMASCHTVGPHSFVHMLYSPLHMYLDLFPRANGTVPDEFDNNEHWYAFSLRRSAIGKSISTAMGLSFY